jgi:excisionase family DNA binding protein
VVEEEKQSLSTSSTPSSTEVPKLSASTSTAELPLFLNVDEVAELLRSTRAAIYAMADRGRLPGVVRIGRRMLISRDALLDSLLEGRAPSPRGTRR